jgi:hypothetical protein
MTTAVRLDPFNIKQVQDLTSTDTINLTDFGNQRDIMFLIIPNNIRSYDFLASFLYTQLFDQLYYRAQYELVGSKNLYVGNELLRHFTPEECKADDGGESYAERYLKLAQEAAKNWNAKDNCVEGHGVCHGEKNVGTKQKPKMQAVTYDDRYYELKAWDDVKNEEIVFTRRPTEALMRAYLKDLKNAKLVNDKGGPALPQPIKIILDEFANSATRSAYKTAGKADKCAA